MSAARLRLMFLGQVIGALRSKQRPSRCGLIANPADYVPELAAHHSNDTLAAAAAQLVGAGHGCDAQRPGEPYNFKAAARMRAGLDIKAAHQAAKIWLV